MSMTDEFADIKKKLGQLPGIIQQRVVVGATRAAAKVVADEAKENVPVRTGLLKKSIAVRMVPKRKTADGHVKFYVVPLSKVKGTAKVSVGGQSGKLKYTTYAYYAHMVEFGTSKMAAQPFLRPAFLNSADKSVKAFQEYALKRIEKEVAKLGRS